ncbi:hypothetical protein HK102_014008 [Quaeritorhiza haematococci]|nr:hypothetical protein HK102_014008 [Quaeritorhiza haematococci]
MPPFLKGKLNRFRLLFTSCVVCTCAIVIGLSNSGMLNAAPAKGLYRRGSVEEVVDTSRLADDVDEYRPILHAMARRGWMNDPCAPVLIDGKYHLFYESNPKFIQWTAPLLWGHLVSDDLIHWEDYDDVLNPTEPYEVQGIFSGNAVPVGYQGLPTIFYTGATRLPIHWTIPYNRGSEVQAMAYSKDGGKTWIRHEKNPLIPEPPPQFDITAFRDPFVFQSSHLVNALKSTSSQSTAFKKMLQESSNPNPDVWFMLVGSGIRHEGGGVILEYSTDMINWTPHPVPFYLRNGGAGKHTEFMEDYGWNFELPSFVGYEDDTTSLLSNHHFMFYGAEGPWKLHGGHRALWSAGLIKQDAQGEVIYDATVTGYLDHGRWYASNSFWDTKSTSASDKSGRRVIIWGWSDEDKKVEKTVQEGGWAGALALPRELFPLTINNVYRRAGTEAIREGFQFGEFVADTSAAANAIGYYKSVATLGISPANLDILLQGSKEFSLQNVEIPVTSSSKDTSRKDGLAQHPLPIKSDVFEALLTIDFNNSPAGGSGASILDTTGTLIGFTIRQSADGSVETTVVFDLAKNEIRVNRDRSIPAEMADILGEKITTTEEIGYFPLLEIKKEGFPIESERSFEQLQLRVVVDRSMLEVYANDRFAMTTRIYAPKAADQVGIVYRNDLGWIKGVSSVDVHYDIPSVWRK